MTVESRSSAEDLWAQLLTMVLRSQQTGAPSALLLLELVEVVEEHLMRPLRVPLRMQLRMLLQMHLPWPLQMQRWTPLQIPEVADEGSVGHSMVG